MLYECRASRWAPGRGPAIVTSATGSRLSATIKQALLVGVSLTAVSFAVPATATPYTGGSIVDFNGTYDSTVRVTTSGGSAFGVNVTQPGHHDDPQGRCPDLDRWRILRARRTHRSRRRSRSHRQDCHHHELGRRVWRACRWRKVVFTQTGVDPITINLTSTGGSSNPPDEAAALYDVGGTINRQRQSDDEGRSNPQLRPLEPIDGPRRADGERQRRHHDNEPRKLRYSPRSRREPRSPAIRP